MIRGVIRAIGLAGAAWSLAACGAPPTPAGPSTRPAAGEAPAVGTGRFAVGAFRVAAEGPCARLAVEAIGDRRLLVFGDTGYDLAGWLPGDEVPAAQSIAVLGPGGAGLDPGLLRGLPRDARGYVPGDLLLGGADDAGAWLLRVTTRYAPGGDGALFARASEGFTRGPRGWQRSPGSPVERPRAAARLPSLPTTACAEGHQLVPLASTTTRGGVMVAGRCDDARVANPAEVDLLVAHGRPGASAWEIHRVPGTSNLDGNVNVAIDARGDTSLDNYAVVSVAKGRLAFGDRVAPGSTK